MAGEKGNGRLFIDLEFQSHKMKEFCGWMVVSVVQQSEC